MERLGCKGGALLCVALLSTLTDYLTNNYTLISRCLTFLLVEGDDLNSGIFLDVAVMKTVRNVFL
jgi:hypothetical protein